MILRECGGGPATSRRPLCCEIEVEQEASEIVNQQRTADAELAAQRCVTCCGAWPPSTGPKSRHPHLRRPRARGPRHRRRRHRRRRRRRARQPRRDAARRARASTSPRASVRPRRARIATCRSGASSRSPACARGALHRVITTRRPGVCARDAIDCRLLPARRRIAARRSRRPAASHSGEVARAAASTLYSRRGFLAPTVARRVHASRRRRERRCARR